MDVFLLLLDRLNMFFGMMMLMVFVVIVVGMVLMLLMMMYMLFGLMNLNGTMLLVYDFLLLL